MPFFEPWTPFGITPDIKAKLLRISPATIDRALKGDRTSLAIRGISGTKPGKPLKKYIPVITYYPWNERKPGFFELDTVHHCGHHDAGEFCLTRCHTRHISFTRTRPYKKNDNCFVEQKNLACVQSSMGRSMGAKSCGPVVRPHKQSKRLQMSSRSAVKAVP
jgi:hypothetical protein